MDELALDEIRGGLRFNRRLDEGNRSTMDQATHNKIVSFIRGIADDVLRDLFKRGKYPDVILPMCVLRRHSRRATGSRGPAR